MPNWSSTVPDNPNGPALPIRRTPPARPLEAIVTSPNFFGCDTHFYRGSTMPCEGPGCEAHLNGIPFRWHAYMSAIDVHSNLHFIFECTALAAEFFSLYVHQHATLRGCHFRATRWNNKPNGRILIRTKPADLGERSLPAPPDIRKCMAIIWSLPDPDVTDNRRDPDHDCPSIHHHPEKGNGKCPPSSPLTSTPTSLPVATNDATIPLTEPGDASAAKSTAALDNEPPTNGPPPSPPQS